MTKLEKIFKERKSPIPTAFKETSVEDGEVLIAWLEGKITTQEASDAIGFANSGSVSSAVPSKLKEFYKRGLLKFEWSKPNSK